MISWLRKGWMISTPIKKRITRNLRFLCKWSGSRCSCCSWGSRRCRRSSRRCGFGTIWYITITERRLSSSTLYNKFQILRSLHERKLYFFILYGHTDRYSLVLIENVPSHSTTVLGNRRQDSYRKNDRFRLWGFFSIFSFVSRGCILARRSVHFWSLLSYQCNLHPMDHPLLAEIKYIQLWYIKYISSPLVQTNTLEQRSLLNTYYVRTIMKIWIEDHELYIFIIIYTYNI